jgi:hypothetical protein
MRLNLSSLLQDRTDVNVEKAINAFGEQLYSWLITGKIVDTLDLYAPSLKGLQDIHAFTCETLESLLFDGRSGVRQAQAAAYLYGEFA